MPTRTATLRKFERLDVAALLWVMSLLTYYVTGNFLAADIFDEAGLPYFGHFIKLLVLGILGFLSLRTQWLYRPSAITRVVSLWILWIIVTGFNYGAEPTLRGHLEQNIIPALIWPLVYLFFYAFSRKHPSAYPFIVAYFCVLAVLCGVLFWRVDALTASYGTPTKESVASGLTLQLNQIYYVLLLLPWILVSRNEALRVLGMVAVGLAVCIALKRGALAAFAASTTIFLCANLWVKWKSSKLSSVLPLVLLVFGAIAFERLNEARGGRFTSRLESIVDDEGGGRLRVYEETSTLISRSSWWFTVIGHGNNAVVRDSTSGLSAHNDWLEVLYDFGLGGLVLYCSLHGLLLFESWKLVLRRSPYGAPFAAAYALFFVVSAVSHLIIYPWYFVFLAAFWGTIQGLVADRQTQVKGGNRSRVPKPALADL